MLDRHLAAARATQAPRSSQSTSLSSASSSSSTLSRDSADHPDSADQAPEVYAQEVSSVWRKAEKRHLVAKGPPEHPPEEWVTICGWRFGRAARAVPPLASHPMCAKCRRSAVVGEGGVFRSGRGSAHLP